MANKYLRTERIPTGYAAEDVLKRFKWPKKTHQKIVDKYYNSKFKKLAPTADTVLTAPADFSWPSISPEWPATMTKHLKKFQSLSVTYGKSISKFEKALKTNKDLAKEYDGFYNVYDWHSKNAKKLAKRCVDDYKKCGIADGELLYSEREANKWNKQLNRTKNKKGNLSENEIKEFKRLIKKTQNYQGKQLKTIMVQMYYILLAKSVLP